MGRIRRRAPDALAVLFAISGIAHLLRPAGYEPLVPPFLPAPGAIIGLSGIAELICAGGLLRRDRWAGPASAALLVAVFPGNVWFAVAAAADPSTTPLIAIGAWLRLPLQVPLIWSALAARASARRA